MRVKRLVFCAAAWLAGSLGATAQQGSPTPSPAPGQTPTANAANAMASPTAVPPTAAPRPHSMSLEVAPEKQGGSSHTADERETSHLGYNYELPKNGVRTTLQPLNITTEKATLQITARNLTATPDSVVVESYFVGEHAGEIIHPDRSHEVVPPGKLFIYDHSTQTLAVPANGSATVRIDSLELRTLLDRSPFAQTGKTAGGSLKAEDGTKQRGWLIRLVADGKVLAVRASSNAFEELCKDGAKFDAFLVQAPPKEAGYRQTIGPFRDYR